MDEEFLGDSLLWGDDNSWAFPILAGEENDGKILIEGGRIVTDAGNLSNEEAPAPPVAKGRRRKATAKASLASTSKHGGGEGSSGGGDSDEHEIHIWTERERRKKMRDMFANLHDLIPQIHQRADKSTIVDEAIRYIRHLHKTIESLEKKKEERLNGGINANPTRCDPSPVTQSQLAFAIPSREAFIMAEQEQGSTSTQGAVTLSSPELPATFKIWTTPNLILNVCEKDAHISICCPKKLGFLTAIMFVMERYKLQMVSAQVSSDRGTRMYMIHARINGGPNHFPEAFFPVEEIFKQAAAEIMLWLNS
ncbi:hypothetical protein ACS0TY_001831 [Phlomoides rotata]